MILEVKNLIKHYGAEPNLVKAVDDITFTVKKGAFVSIMGKSGCGKTTTMHMIGGLDRPTSGSILINGREIVLSNTDSKNAIKDSEDLAIFRRKNIGFVFQHYNLLPILDVRNNILLPLGLDGQKVDIEFFNEVISTLSIADKLDKSPNKLSGGEQQRVAIARALIAKPSLILADEPTGNLDSKTSEDVLSLFESTSKEFNQTIIMVTHNQEVANHAQQQIFMSDGKII